MVGTNEKTLDTRDLPPQELQVEIDESRKGRGGACASIGAGPDPIAEEFEKAVCPHTYPQDPSASRDWTGVGPPHVEGHTHLTYRHVLLNLGLGSRAGRHQAG